MHKRFAGHSWYRVRTIGTRLGSTHPNRSDEAIMNLSTTPKRRAPQPAGPAARHKPLSDIDPLGTAAARAAGRVTDVADRRSGQSTFNSAF